MLAKILSLLAQNGKSISLCLCSHDDRVTLTASNSVVIAVLQTTGIAKFTDYMALTVPADTLLNVRTASFSHVGELVIDGKPYVFEPMDEAMRERAYSTLRSYIFPSMDATEMVEEESELLAWEQHVEKSTLFAKFHKLLNEPILKKTATTAVMTMPAVEGGMYYAVTLRGQALVPPKTGAAPVKTAPAEAPKTETPKPEVKKEEAPVAKPAEKKEAKKKPEPAAVTPEVMPDGDPGEGLGSDGIDDILGGEAPAPAKLEAEPPRDEVQAQEQAAPAAETPADPNVCGNKLPDGRVCNKAKGHEGKHWYGGLGGVKSSPPPEKAATTPAQRALAEAGKEALKLQGEPTALANSAPVDNPVTIDDLIGALETELASFTGRSKELVRKIKAAIKEQSKEKAASSKEAVAAQLKAMLAKLEG